MSRMRLRLALVSTLSFAVVSNVLLVRVRACLVFGRSLSVVGVVASKRSCLADDAVFPCGTFVFACYVWLWLRLRFAVIMSCEFVFTCAFALADIGFVVFAIHDACRSRLLLRV